MPELIQSTHPIVKNALSRLRDIETQTAEFRHQCHLASYPLIIEATKETPTAPAEVTTPLEKTSTEILNPRPVFIPILRAGLGMLKVAMELFPDSEVGHLGLQRDEKTAEASTYYEKLPPLSDKPVFMLDPMLATGGSASASIDIIKKNHSPSSLTLISIVAAPEGIEHLQATHPDLNLIVGAIDRELNSQKFIVPGLGDFGDRYFGT